MTLVYSLTETGAEAAAAGEGYTSVPLEYRRLLRLISAGGHIDVLRGRLRRFTNQMIDDWLKELEEQKMLESKPAGNLEDFTFTGRKAPRLPALLDEDSRRLAKTAVIAGATLLRSGSYIADDRVANLPMFNKPPTQTLILLVEDDPDQVALGQLRLKLSGYQVRTIERAKQLSRNLREDRRPDLVLLDVMLPDTDGYDVCLRIKSDGTTAHIPVIFLSARGEVVDKVRGLSCGAADYVTKPWNAAELLARIDAVLAQARSARAPRLEKPTLRPQRARPIT